MSITTLICELQAPRDRNTQPDPCPHLVTESNQYKLLEMVDSEGNKILCCGCWANHSMVEVCR